MRTMTMNSMQVGPFGSIDVALRMVRLFRYVFLSMGTRVERRRKFGAMATLRWLAALLLALAPALAAAAPAWIKLTPPAQTSYTVPVSYEIKVTSGSGMQ